MPARVAENSAADRIAPIGGASSPCYIKANFDSAARRCRNYFFLTGCLTLAAWSCPQQALPGVQQAAPGWQQLLQQAAPVTQQAAPGTQQEEPEQQLAVAEQQLAPGWQQSATLCLLSVPPEKSMPMLRTQGAIK